MRHSSTWSPLSRRLDSADLIVIDWELIKLLMDYFLIVFLIFWGEALLELFEILFSYDSLCEQFLWIEFISSWVVFDLLIHQRLSKGRLILFIMSISSVSNNIDKDVLLEFLTISDCYPHTLIKNVRLVSIYMDHGGINCLSNLSAIEWGSWLMRRGGKTDLVV